jgi:hypothetical protein
VAERSEDPNWARGLDANGPSEVESNEPNDTDTGAAMSPMTLVDGRDRPETRLVQERDHAQRRLIDLAAAIREHEQALRARPVAVRPPDDHLYRRLRQICGD